MTAITGDLMNPTNYEKWEAENIRRHVATALMAAYVNRGHFSDLNAVEKSAALAVKAADTLLAELAK